MLILQVVKQTGSIYFLPQKRKTTCWKMGRCVGLPFVPALATRHRLVFVRNVCAFFARLLAYKGMCDGHSLAIAPA